MASAIPSTSPGMSVKKKAPSSPVPSASPRNSPPWLLHSIAPSFSPQEKRKGSPELRSAGVYLLTWTKLRKSSNCTLDCMQSLPAGEWVAWTSLPSRLAKTERDLVNYLKQGNPPKEKEKIHVRKGFACVCVREKMDMDEQMHECSPPKKKKSQPKKGTGVWDIKSPLITHSRELGFLIHVFIHIFAACWESGAVAFANVHLCAICFYCISETPKWEDNIFQSMNLFLYKK